MEYKKFGKTIVARIDLGEEIVESVRKIALAENIKLAMVNALGAVNRFEVGVYNVSEKVYHKKVYEGTYEIVSLHGSINTMNGELYTHLHLSAGSVDGNVVGGHLYSGIIGGTCEMFIDIVDGVVDRIKDEKIGLNVFKF